ncbi:MAG: S4 domain-containing protein [Bacteroidetes bacterium]|nr:S4 domain-containing protein [Bacteroidota bacterium]
MRVDKYLWCIRKYKTRSQATDALKKSRVRVNDEPVKASREIKIGDRIAFKKDTIEFEIEVLGIPKSRVGAKLLPELIKEVTRPEELEKREFINLMHKLNRPRGTGRPTKKERRDLGDFMDLEE